MNKKHLFLRIVATVLILACVFPVTAMAAQPRASDYLSSYSGYVYPAAWGKIQVWFEVLGTNDMDEIGSLEIRLYESTDNENWSWVKTFDYTDNAGMLAYDDWSHTGHVEYSGTIGRYYKAYICIWAGKNGAGDTRYFWTSARRASLFAG